MEDNRTGSPCGSSEESLRKAAQSVIDQHALGCPRFWMHLCDVSVYKAVLVRAVAVLMVHLTSCTILLDAVLSSGATQVLS